MIKYSVIIPAYNAESYYKNIILFIEKIQKKRKDVEFIVVNDGSTDKTNDLFSPHNNITYAYQDNQGVSSARNHGLKLATGEFILFLDADDNYTEDIFDVLDNYTCKDTDILFFNYNISNHNISNPIQSMPYRAENFLKSFLEKKTNSCICSICFRRSFIKHNKLSFPKGYSFGEDIYFILKSALSTKKEILYIPNILFNYNLENSGTVATPINKNKIHVVDLYNSIEVESKEMSEYLNYFTQRTYIYLIKLAIKYGVTDSTTLTKITHYQSTLSNPVKINTPLDFKLAKYFIKLCPSLIFSLIKVRQHK